ncbi:hypothetical protein KQI77_06720 [Clostridium sp. MSJ-8]|uniref:NERD domain-containing protein n=1 Tax=Clostridium sp. MSJ-8 TaxID=2841510 RepID=UPI001C0F0605|nr:NERD domain-containing protein [Clostridium sp. MSJ-8]MBU5487862.1 hypothetical protein [Clostridium sp. MSJ-8]
MNIFKRIFYIFSALFLVYIVYKISILLLMVGLDTMSREFFLLVLGIYLVIPLVKNLRLKTSDLNCIEINNNISRVCKKIKDSKTTSLLGLTLKYNNIEKYFDAIIINKHGVFNIVFCDYKGNIVVSEYNSWKKVNNRREETLVSPINKIRENRELLSKVYKEEEINDLIVMIDESVDVTEEESSSVPIVMYMDLADYIDNFDNEEEYNEDELYDKLYPIIVTERELQQDNKLFQKYLDYKWQYRSRITIISFAAVLYIFKMIG